VFKVSVESAPGAVVELFGLGYVEVVAEQGVDVAHEIFPGAALGGG
jgi:hypothetical protein